MCIYIYIFFFSMFIYILFILYISIYICYIYILCLYVYVLCMYIYVCIHNVYIYTHIHVYDSMIYASVKQMVGIERWSQPTRDSCVLMQSRPPFFLYLLRPGDTTVARNIQQNKVCGNIKIIAIEYNKFSTSLKRWALPSDVNIITPINNGYWSHDPTQLSGLWGTSGTRSDGFRLLRTRSWKRIRSFRGPFLLHVRRGLCGHVPCTSWRRLGLANKLTRDDQGLAGFHNMGRFPGVRINALKRARNQTASGQETWLGSVLGLWGRHMRRKAWRWVELRALDVAGAEGWMVDRQNATWVLDIGGLNLSYRLETRSWGMLCRSPNCRFKKLGWPPTFGQQVGCPVPWALSVLMQWCSRTCHVQPPNALWNFA